MKTQIRIDLERIEQEMTRLRNLYMMIREEMEERKESQVIVEEHLASGVRQIQNLIYQIEALKGELSDLEHKSR